jgi:putative transport protein
MADQCSQTAIGEGAGAAKYSCSSVNPTSVTTALIVLASVAGSGLALGTVRVRGVSLGVAGVLFTGLAAGHLGFTPDERLLVYIREFGLVVFVWTIGMQVGPGFMASLRREGLRLNLLAASVVALGVVTALVVYAVADVPSPVLVGLLAGATTNTPSLGAGQQALAQSAGTAGAAVRDLEALAGVGYAVAYPFGVLGIILSLLVVRAVLRIDVAREREQLARALAGGAAVELRRLNLEVSNPNLAGARIGDVPGLGDSAIAVARILQGSELHVPTPDTRLSVGDVIAVVGSPEALERVRMVVGQESRLDLRSMPSTLASERLIVTRTGALGRTLGELDFPRRFDVQITRVSRAEVEIAASPGVRLQYGDTVLAVGGNEAIRKVAQELGNSPKSLNYPHLIPMFLGLVIGVAVGQYPLSLPGISVPVKLGLAGGPLLVAMVLSRFGSFGSLVWYMPVSANYMLRELGIVMFLAAVGLASGDQVVETLVAGSGITWMALGALITVLPVLVVGVLARQFLGMNYLALSGLLAGSTTDPPALSFANSLADSDGPSVAYATVYPLTMFLRVVSVQVLAYVLA